MKKNTTVLLTLLTLILLSSTCFLQSAEIQPKVSKMKLGDFEIIALLDASFDMESKLFKTGNPNIIKQMMPTGKLPATVNSYLIKTGKENILVDTGVGVEFKFGKGLLLDSLKKANLNPQDINIVVITHSHFDHVGGLVAAGKIVFPNAKLMFSKTEMTYFDDNALKALPPETKPYFEPANLAIKIYKEKIETFIPGAQIRDGISIIDLSGHTPGHCGILIESKGKKLLIAGDIIHIAKVQSAHPDYSLVYDVDVTKAAEVRNNILKRSINENFLVAGIHIPFPGIVKVVSAESGYKFISAK